MKLQDPTDYEKMGRLIRLWSRDRSSRPASIAELEAQLTAVGITAEITETELRFVDYTVDQLLFKIPPPEMLARLDARDGWPLPDFYDATYVDPVRKPVEEVEFGKLNVERLGDYSITNCAG